MWYFGWRSFRGRRRFEESGRMGSENLKGYRVGELHPTAKDYYEQTRQTKSQISNERIPRDSKGLVQPIGRGRQGIRAGATSAKAPKTCYETKEGDDS
jgi:hypothetical protein